MNVRIYREYNVRKETTHDLNLNDYINCDTVDDLKYAIRKKYLKDSDFTEEDLTHIEMYIDNKFIDEWKKLVGFISNNVMTENKRNKIMENKENYEVQKYPGKYLNDKKAHKTGYCSNCDFDWGDYHDFLFDNNKCYICYVQKTYGWFTICERLMYAEPVENMSEQEKKKYTLIYEGI